MTRISTSTSAAGRTYQDTFRADLPAYPGVTSIIDTLNKPFLQRWAAGLTAELAVDSLAYIKDMATRDREGAVTYLRDAARRYTRSRAHIGSQAHDAFERLIRGETLPLLHPDVAPYADQFADFLSAVNPELISAEDVAWSDTHQYAGSPDAILRIWMDQTTMRPAPDRNGAPVVVMVDWKTGKNIYPEVALQLAAYSRADLLIDADGESQDMPSVDGGAVLHVTPDGWDFKAVEIGDDVFGAFLALRRAYDWKTTGYRGVICRSLAKSGRRVVTGTQRRG